MTGTERSEFRVVVVGAGIVGLFTAYHLACAGAGPIVVVDRGFLSSGASGRNGGGVRQQWETPATIRLVRESIERFRGFGREFGYNIWFRQGGYLFLAGTDAEMARLESVRRIVTSEGLDARRVDPATVGRLAPGLALDRIVGGSYLRTDGTLYPFPAIWGLYEAVQRLGVEVRLHEEVLAIESTDGRVTGVTTRRGRIRAPTVVNAAGGWSSELSHRAGLATVNAPTRHEILATEPLKPFLDPMVVRVADGLYFSQTMRGEIVGGITVPHPTGTALGMPSSPEFLISMARALTSILPAVAGLGVLRAWSGFYDDTPDGLPIVGEDPRLPGFVHANGLGGHGFMVAPAIGERVAAGIVGEKTDLDPAQFGPARFLASGGPSTVERLQLG